MGTISWRIIDTMHIRPDGINSNIKNQAAALSTGELLRQEDPKEKVINEMPAIIIDLSSNLKKASTIDEAFSILNNACTNDGQLKMLKPNIFNYKGYQFYVGLEMFNDENTQKLAFANKLSIHSAPQLIDYIKFPDRSGVIITYHKGCEDGVVFPYKEFENQINQEAKQRFIEDMKKLTSQGCIHPHALRGPAYWSVNSSGEIVLSSWEILRHTTNNKEREDLIKSLNKYLRVN